MLLSVSAATGREIISMLDMMMEADRTECCAFWIVDGEDKDKVVIWGELKSNRDN